MLYLIYRTLGTVFMLLMLIVAWILAFIVQWAVKIVMWPFSTPVQRGDVCGYIFRYFNLLIFINPLFYVRILKPRPEYPKDRPILVMINHRSYVDPWVFIPVFLPWIDCKWIFKASLLNVPFGGWCLANNNDLAVHFTKDKGGWGTKKGSIKRLMDDATEVLRRNKPIAVFPEGVRNASPQNGLAEFKTGFFELAIKEGALIAPVAASGTEKLNPVDSMLMGTGVVYISSAPLIDSKGHTTESLIAETRQAIIDMCATHPNDCVKTMQ